MADVPSRATKVGHHRWLQGPLNRPENLELHAHKRYQLPDLFEVNSWFRCKTATRLEVESESRPVPNLLLVEQDLNSLAEVMDSRELSEDEIRRFFTTAPLEMRRILDLYFPTGG